MAILVFAILVLVTCALVVAAINYAPITQPFKNLIVCLIILAAALVIAQRAGLF